VILYFLIMTLPFVKVVKVALLSLMAVCLSGLLWGCQTSQASDVIRLTLWQGVNPPPNREVLQKLVDKFNQQHPKIQVESLYVGQGDQQMPKILAAVVGNAAPDMLWYAPMITGQLVDLEAVRSLDDFLAQSKVKAELDPTLIETMRYEGKTWSVPFGTNNVGIYYRPSLFEQAGIKELPRTWEEFRAVAKRLTRDTNGDGQPDQYGMLLPLGKGEWTVFTWLPFMFSGGGDFVATPKLPAGTLIYGNNIISGAVVPKDAPQSNSPKRSTDEYAETDILRIIYSEASPSDLNIVNSGAIDALQLWRTLIQDGSAILSQPERGYELDGFLAGKVAMQLSGPWTLGQLQATKADFAVMPIPTGKQQATAIGGENLFIFKSTPERERAAFEFAEFVMSEAFQTEWAIGTGYLPTNLKSRESDAYKAFRAKQPAVDVFLNQAQFGRSRPIFPGYNRISDNLGRAIEATLMGKSTPEEALQASQQRLDLIFK
jgi:multiple sugar transport system substrate-binding protein